MIVQVPVSRLYRYPTAESEHVDDVLYGTKVVITDTVSEFYRVTTSYGYDGWLLSSTVTEELAEPNRMIIKPWADLLPSAENFGSPIMTLPMGSLVDAAYSPQFDRHAFVVLPDKRMFYIRKDALAPIPHDLDEQTARDTIVKSAMAFIGAQYRWGGRTQDGVDCSGLAFTAYQTAGITIWRDASFEKNPSLRKIAPEDAKKGDLYFFNGHMGVALGNMKFIHSSSGKNAVGINSLCESDGDFMPWAKENFICAGTVF